MAASYAIDVLHVESPQVVVQSQHESNAEEHVAMILDEVTRVYDISFDNLEHLSWMLMHGLIQE